MGSFDILPMESFDKQETTNSVNNIKSESKTEHVSGGDYIEKLEYIKKEEEIGDLEKNTADTNLRETLEGIEMNNPSYVGPNTVIITPVGPNTVIITPTQRISKQTIEYETPTEPKVEITPLKPQQITINNWEASIPNPF